VTAQLPEAVTARVPIAVVTGANGKSTTVRMIAHLLGLDGRRVGVTSTDGLQAGDETVYRGDALGPRSAETVRASPTVEVVVLETARGGYDRADVTNITGADGIATFEDQVESLAAEEIHLVLGADDPNAAGLADRPAVRECDPVMRYFAMSAANPIVERHLRRGGVAYVVADGWLVEGAADRTTWLLPAAEVAGSSGGRAGVVIANALAATAAVRAFGVPPRAVARGLRTFDPHRRSPGRARTSASARRAT
jgi:cyanophycin synthetase